MGDGQPRLLDEVRDRIRRKHYSIRTEQAYVDWIRASCCITTRGTPATWGRRRSSFDALRANHRERREFSAYAVRFGPSAAALQAVLADLGFRAGSARAPD